MSSINILKKYGFSEYSPASDQTLNNAKGCFAFVHVNSGKGWLLRSSDVLSSLRSYISKINRQHSRLKNNEETYLPAEFSLLSLRDPQFVCYYKVTAGVEDSIRLEIQVRKDLKEAQVIIERGSLTEEKRSELYQLKQNLKKQKNSQAVSEETSAVKSHVQQRKGKPVIAAGRLYSSVVAAAKSLNISSATITYRCQSSNFKDYRYADKTS